MKKILLTVATLTLLVSAQTTIANDSPGEALAWFATADNTVQTVNNKPLQINNVSFKQGNYQDDNYDATKDIFSIHYMSNN